jgi:hypothetical protein
MRTDTRISIDCAWSVTVDSKDNVWVCALSSGLLKYDGTVWTLFNSKNSMLPAAQIFSLTEDIWGNKWIATGEAGVAVYHEGGVTIPFRLDTRAALHTRLTVTDVAPRQPKVELTWNTGVLQMIDAPDGPWADLQAVTSPCSLACSGLKAFYRVRIDE